jgi:hypothetical protein
VLTPFSLRRKIFILVCVFVVVLRVLVGVGGGGSCVGVGGGLWRKFGSGSAAGFFLL